MSMRFPAFSLRRTWIYLVMPLVTLSGIVASAFLYTALRNREITNAVNQLENNCDLKQTEIQRQLAGGITLLYAMLAIVQEVGTGNMNNDMWNSYASTLIKEGNWSVLSFSRSELVSLSGLDEFETRTSLEVVQTVPGGGLEPVTHNRPFYLPIVDTYPSTARIRGLDNLAEPARREVVLRGYRTRDLVVSDPFYAPNANPAGGGPQRAFLLFLPVYDANGFPEGALTEAYFENTIVRDRFSGGITYAFGIGEAVLFSDPIDAPRATIRERRFPLADRNVTLHCGVVFRESIAPGLTAAFGIVLSLLVTIAGSVILIVLRRRRLADEKATREARERTTAEDAYRVKSTFLNHVSHELKTPLNGIQGVLSLLLDDSLEEEQKESVQQGLHKAEDLSDMLENLIEFSAFEAGAVSARMEDIPLSTIVDDVVVRAQQLLKNQNVFHHPDNVPNIVVRTDGRKVSRIMGILLHNAFKYTKKGRVSLELDLKPREVSIAILDTGRGIPPDFLEKLRRQDYAQTSRTDGLGLGLALAYKFAELLAARIDIHSVEQRGSTFTLHLPDSDRIAHEFLQSPRHDGGALREGVELQEIHVTSPPEPQPKAQTSPELQVEASKGMGVQPTPATGVTSGISQENPPKHKKVILVADDNDLNRKVLCRMLRGLGYEYIEANDGWEALEAYKREGDKVGLILMDIQMPIMDGVEATKALRVLHNDIPIVAVTANAIETEAQRYKDAGMTAVMTKPVNKDQLRHILSLYS
jgi:signal transduction histidine kinase/CheY-like chemotaxis protein